MAIAIDQANLGNGFDDTLDAAWTFNTTANVASGGFIVAVVGWYGGSPTLSSVGGGGLTWVVDYASDPGGTNPERLAVASAQAPSGLASSTTLTFTLSDVAVGKFATAMSFTGVKTSSPVDGTPPTMTQGTTAGWASGSCSIQAGSVVVGGVWEDAVTNNTPTSPSVEASEHNSASNTLVAEYRIESSSGSYTLAGTLGTGAEWASSAVAYLAAADTVQTLLPSADSVDGNWTDNSGGTSLAAQIDETTASDTDYILSTMDPQDSGCRVKLAAGSDPASSSGHIIHWRIRKDSTGGSTVGMTAKLYQGGGNSQGAGTLIATFTRSNVSSSWTTFDETLSGAEADSITNYADLYLEFYADT